MLSPLREWTQNNQQNAHVPRRCPPRLCRRDTRKPWKGSMPGEVDTTARPLLNRQQTDLLEALPPVVTGVDFHNTFELWEISSRNAKVLTRRGEREEATPAGFAASKDEEMGNAAGDSVDRDRNVETPRGELGSIPNTAAAAAAPAVEESCELSVNPDQGYLEAFMQPLGIGLMRLCRRAVILLTRSPACPDLVAWQTDPAKQRTYDQMEPLFARANMTYRDLHPRSVGFFPKPIHSDSAV